MIVAALRFYREFMNRPHIRHRFRRGENVRRRTAECRRGPYKGSLKTKKNNIVFFCFTWCQKCRELQRATESYRESSSPRPPAEPPRRAGAMSKMCGDEQQSGAAVLTKGPHNTATVTPLPRRLPRRLPRTQSARPPARHGTATFRCPRPAASSPPRHGHRPATGPPPSDAPARGLLTASPRPPAEPPISMSKMCKNRRRSGAAVLTKGPPRRGPRALQPAE